MVKRYEMVVEHCHNDSWHQMDVRLGGRYVLYSDYRRLEEALEFYADRDNNVGWPNFNSDVGRDDGKRAREALGGAKLREAE